MKPKHQIDSKTLKRDCETEKSLSVSSSVKTHSLSARKLLKAFSKSPLALCCPEDMAKARQISRHLGRSEGLIFIFAMAGWVPPGICSTRRLRGGKFFISIH